MRLSDSGLSLLATNVHIKRHADTFFIALSSRSHTGKLNYVAALYQMDCSYTQLLGTSRNVYPCKYNQNIRLVVITDISKLYLLMLSN